MNKRRQTTHPGCRSGPMRLGRSVAFVLAMLGIAGPAQGCGLELVLAMDVSRSVEKSEFDLQIGGLAAAFRDPKIIEAIAWTPGGVMATVTQWSGPESQSQPVPWTYLTGAASATAFADAIAHEKRAFFAAYTAIGDALIHANSLSRTNPRHCARRVIDVSGDGASNRGAPPRPVAEALAASGVTVNGLVIRGAWPDPAMFYKRNVVRGDGAFLEVAADFSDYAAAIRRKLLRELAPQLAAR